MSVALLKLNIDLPTNCYDCPLKTIINEDKVALYCNLLHATFEGEHFCRQKHRDCPITEIPKVPGRLLILSENIIEANKVVMSFSIQRWISEVNLSHATVGVIDMEADKKDIDEYKCKDCSKAYTDDCPKEKCWKNDYQEFIEEDKK